MSIVAICLLLFAVYIDAKALIWFTIGALLVNTTVRMFVNKDNGQKK